MVMVFRFGMRISDHQMGVKHTVNAVHLYKARTSLGKNPLFLMHTYRFDDFVPGMRYCGKTRLSKAF